MNDFKYRDYLIFEDGDNFIACCVKFVMPMESSNAYVVETLEHFAYRKNKHTQTLSEFKNSDFLVPYSMLQKARKVKIGDYYQFIMDKIGERHQKLEKMFNDPDNELISYNSGLEVKLGDTFVEYMFIVENRDKLPLGDWIFSEKE